MDLIVLKAAKKYVDETLTGAGALKGKDGNSIVNVDTNENNQFVFTMTDGSKITGGYIPAFLKSVLLYKNRLKNKKVRKIIMTSICTYFAGRANTTICEFVADIEDVVLNDLSTTTHPGRNNFAHFTSCVLI